MTDSAFAAKDDTLTRTRRRKFGLRSEDGGEQIDGFSGTNLEHAGEYNQRVILQAIRIHGPITRGELARISGLTAPTIANITRRLLAEKLIKEIGRLHGGRGQPAMQLMPNGDGAFSIGVNVDRDHITLVVLDLLGRVRYRVSEPYEFPLPSDLERFLREQAPNITQHREFGAHRILGVGFGIPDDLGRQHFPNQPGSFDAWNQFDAQALAMEIFGKPAQVENDAAAAAIGEMQFGHGMQVRNFFYLLINSGLGGGLVLDSRYYRGAKGRSGEIGFLPQADGTILQDVLSISGMLQVLARHGAQSSLASDIDSLIASHPAAVNEWLASASYRLAEACRTVACLIDPDVILLGGRLPRPLLTRLANASTDILRSPGALVPSVPHLAVAMLSDDAPAIGAAILPFNEHLLPTTASLMKVGAA